MPPAPCAVPECGDPVHLQGLCVACYHRRWRNPEGFDVTQPRKRKGRQVEPSALETENRELRVENAQLRDVAQALWLRLSTMNGWAVLIKRHLPREDTIPANTAALEAGREIGLGD